MKVHGSRGSSKRWQGAVIVITAVAMAASIGAGLVPMLAASAQTADEGRAVAEDFGDMLPPADERSKADSLRTPSDLGTLEERASGTRTPTIVRRAPVRPRAVADAPAPGAQAGDGWKTARVSWYGPGFYGNTMAGGGTLQPDSMVVAHRGLAFGTRIEFSYNGRTCVAVVRDRGPYVGGRTFDLGPGTAKALGFGGVGTVSYRIL